MTHPSTLGITTSRMIRSGDSTRAFLIPSIPSFAVTTAKPSLSNHTGKTHKEIAKESERDRFFDPEEARGFGLIDHVVTASKAADKLQG